jgi:elongation factor Ts
MQIAAMNPLVVNEGDALPLEIGEGMGEPVLMKQPYIRDQSKDIRQLVNEAIGKTGENIQVRRFSRFELGV